MDTSEIKKFVLQFQESDPSNRIAEDIAKKPEYVNREIFDGVLCGVAAADDVVIASLKDNKDANIDMIQPAEWLPGAKSVISIFTPFARWVTESNMEGDWPSGAWLNGRIEGQKSLVRLTLALAERIRGEGYEAVAPSLDPRFKSSMKGSGLDESLFSSNWSERHVAFASGLGTFGLSRGIITELGMAGRLSSLVTTLPLEPTPRPYTDLLEYCVKCGACIDVCPPEAISIAHLKDNRICDKYIAMIREKEEPYYACGKCQCGTPCSYGIPAGSDSRAV